MSNEELRNFSLFFTQYRVRSWTVKFRPVWRKPYATPQTPGVIEPLNNQFVSVLPCTDPWQQTPSTIYQLKSASGARTYSIWQKFQVTRKWPAQRVRFQAANNVETTGIPAAHSGGKWINIRADSNYANEEFYGFIWGLTGAWDNFQQTWEREYQAVVEFRGFNFPQF